MKKVYILCFVCLFSHLLTACSKEVFKSYDRRVIGTWKLHDIDKFGFGRSNNIPFGEDGIFTFGDNGQLTYLSGRNVYKGSWDIIKNFRDDNNVNTLHITLIDFVNQQVITEYFSRILFTGTNRFNTSINESLRTYVFRFVRQ